MFQREFQREDQKHQTNQLTKDQQENKLRKQKGRLDKSDNWVALEYSFPKLDYRFMETDRNHWCLSISILIIIPDYHFLFKHDYQSAALSVGLWQFHYNF